MTANRTFPSAVVAIPRSYSRLEGPGGLLANLVSHYKPRNGRVLAHILDEPYIEEEQDECERLPPEELGEILGAAYNTRYMSIQTPFLDDNDDGEEDVQQAGSGMNSRKRYAEEEELDFAVDDTFAHELSDQPAWTVRHAALGNHLHRSTGDRQKRSPATEDQRQGRDTRYIKGGATGGSGGGGAPDKMKRPWECEARIKWIDLGEEYFPRYLRTVECAKTQCFYGRFTCQPRSFTIKLLRRRPGRCVPIRSAQDDDEDGFGGPRTTEAMPGQQAFRTGEDGLPAGLKELWVWEERAVNFCCDCAAASGHRKY